MISRLDEIRERAEAATAGPWHTDKGHSIWRMKWAGKLFAAASVNENAAADAEFIAHARQDVPLLLAVAEAARNYTEYTETIENSRVYGNDFQPPEYWRLRDALAALEASDPGPAG